jgi:hypothetical protein
MNRPCLPPPPPAVMPRLPRTLRLVTEIIARKAPPSSPTIPAVRPSAVCICSADTIPSGAPEASQ